MTEKPTILVVDDEILLRDLLFNYFTTHGYEVLLAEDGEPALKLLEDIHAQVDVALIDLRMPRMDGVELMKRIRKKGWEIPFIVMTAYPTLDSAIEAVRHDATDYVQKPFAITDLERAVERALEIKKMQVENESLKERIKYLESELSRNSNR